MDGSTKESPFPPANEIPLHRNAPLAPSQELAYRKKCIQLKRRLNEIEINNDSTRKRIAQEKEHVQKMRLLRAILLNHLKTIMETPGKKLTDEQLEKIGVMANGNGHEAELASQELAGELLRRPEGETLLDDSSEESEEEEPEPSERPERRRRTNNNYRETIMSTNSLTGTNPSAYQPPMLPSLAPASSLSPAAPRDPSTLTSSFRVTSSTPASSIAQPPYIQPQYPVETPQAQQSSPIASNQSIGIPYQTPTSNHHRASEPMSTTTPETNGLHRSYASLPPQPVRPLPPFDQFTDHMRPQLQADDYPADQITDRIKTEWQNLSQENRHLWDVRYEEQMVEYTHAMDEWKKTQKREAPSIAGSGR